MKEAGSKSFDENYKEEVEDDNEEIDCDNEEVDGDTEDIDYGNEEISDDNEKVDYDDNKELNDADEGIDPGNETSETLKIKRLRFGMPSVGILKQGFNYWNSSICRWKIDLANGIAELKSILTCVLPPTITPYNGRELVQKASIKLQLDVSILCATTNHYTIQRERISAKSFDKIAVRRFHH
ncbi:hypothetical protein QE152_g4318 [Popillia japonica]|uniref:Uncharacterized protein n=1 Tax=Popillia japonica TaxID=7064 RepID=A0AAW1N196_POPJA